MSGTQNVEDVTLTIEAVSPSDFCMLIPNSMLGDDETPEANNQIIRDLFRLMERNGWLFSDWGRDHGTHCEAWFIPFNPEDADE